MAKIRGIKPDFWTDEKIVALKIPTRLFFIGLWNFCDDCGVFEWKPLELKMKVFPADNFDTTSALRELVEKKCIKKFDKDEKTYGIITNFQKHQRPDKRFLTFLFTDEQAFISNLVEDTTSTPCVHHDDIEVEVEGDIEVDKSSTKIANAKSRYGNEEINNILIVLKEKIGIDDFTDSQKWQRIYAKHLLNLGKKIGKEDFGGRLQNLLKDSFQKKRINSIKVLYEQMKGYIHSENNDIIKII